MQYMGGKSRIARSIAEIINEIPRWKIKNCQTHCSDNHAGCGGGECSSDIRKQVADVYAATCGSFMSIGCDVCPTLMARDYKQSHIVCYKDGGTENDYV